MRQNNYYLVILVICLSLFGCMSEKNQGQFSLSPSSAEWIPFQGGERVVFVNNNPQAENIAMTYELSKRKSVFNQITDCYNKNILMEECKVYSMECNFITATSMDKKNNITYSVEKGQENGNFYDEVKLRVQFYGNPEMTMRFQVFNDSKQLSKDCQFNDKVSFGEKWFENVYVKESNGQAIYFSKERGVIALKMDNENLWIRM